MISRIHQACDWETGRVWLATAYGAAAYLSGVNAMLTTIAVASTIIYTWKKILSNRPPKDDE